MDISDLTTILQDNNFLTPGHIVIVRRDDNNYLYYSVEIEVEQWHDTEKAYRTIRDLIDNKFSQIDVGEHIFSVDSVSDSDTLSIERPENVAIDDSLQYYHDVEYQEWLNNYDYCSSIDEARRDTNAVFHEQIIQNQDQDQNQDQNQNQDPYCIDNYCIDVIDSEVDDGSDYYYNRALFIPQFNNVCY
jgi:hypothetical protein